MNRSNPMVTIHFLAAEFLAMPINSVIGTVHPSIEWGVIGPVGDGGRETGSHAARADGDDHYALLPSQVIPGRRDAADFEKSSARRANRGIIMVD